MLFSKSFFGSPIGSTCHMPKLLPDKITSLKVNIVRSFRCAASKLEVVCFQITSCRHELVSLRSNTVFHFGQTEWFKHHGHVQADGIRVKCFPLCQSPFHRWGLKVTWGWSPGACVGVPWHTCSTHSLSDSKPPCDTTVCRNSVKSRCSEETSRNVSSARGQKFPCSHWNNISDLHM